MAQILENNNRRAAYRVKPESSDELNLSVLGERHQLIRGQVTDVAIGGASVRFDVDNAPKLASGDHVVMAFASRQYEYGTNVLAKVISMTEDSAAKIVRVSFDDQYEPLNIDRDELFALFNRRAMQRGAAEEGTEDFVAKVSPASGGEEQLSAHPVSIVNISNTGVSFTVDKETDEQLKAYSEIRIQLKRSDNGGVNTVACNIRHRSKAGNAYIYGCEYDWSATTDPLAVVEDLVSYLFELSDRT